MRPVLRFLLLGLLLLAGPGQAAAQHIATHSGHHYSWLEGARIGHDFGRNPWSEGGSRTEGFASTRGRAVLRQALARAVEAGEESMSFDFGFDLRSIVVRDPDGALRLDSFVLEAIAVFLAEVDSSHARAREQGRSFSADVVLFDFRLADNQRLDVGGEAPEFILDPQARRPLFAALSPALARLGNHPRLTLNLMNEPEFLAFPVAKAIARIQQGTWRPVYWAQAGAGKAVARDQEVVLLLEALGPQGHVRVQRDPRTGGAKLSATPARVEEVDQFLIELRQAIATVAPRARATIGWADDRSAIENTLRLERQAGQPLTEVVSFHVYDVPTNPWHPLATTRGDFARAGLGEREIRVTEWGLGSLKDQGTIRAAMADAFSQVEAAGFEGVLFWWDADHAFDHAAYGQTISLFAPAPTAVELDMPTAPSALEPAYPNPFNSQVHIRYSLRQAGSITLCIYNLAGQPVRELAYPWQEAGAHEITWDGSGSASGIYLYELQASNFTSHRLMTLVK